MARRLRAEEQLIILSAGTEARRQATRQQIDRLQAQVDWSVLGQMLRTSRLLPRLGPRIVEASNGYSAEFATTVSSAMDAGRRQGASLQLIAERVAALFVDAGIRCSTLKGPHLSEALYGDPGRRPSGDIDLLVAAEDLIEAVDIVRTLGYEAPTEHVERGGLPLLHWSLIHARGALPPIELHWRVHWYEGSFARDRLLAPSLASSSAWRPAPIDGLTALLLFYARDGFNGLPLATDIGAWWDTYGGEVQPGALDQAISTYPALERVIATALRVAEKMVGLPGYLLSHRGRSVGARGRLAAGLAEPYPRSSHAQVYAEMGLVDGLLAPPKSFYAFVKRQIVLPREVLEQHALTAQETRVSSTLGHSARVLGRYGLALVRLVLRAGDRGSSAGLSP